MIDAGKDHSGPLSQRVTAENYVCM